jgi:hypothetical protein
MKTIFITENQLDYIKQPYDLRKVNIIKNYLDKGFKRGTITGIGENGYPLDMKVVCMLSSNGEPLRNMTAEQLFYLLQDRFSNIYPDKKQRDRFLKKVMTDWYEKRIDKNGIPSKNMI